MRYYQTWSDFSRRPEVKQLIENKGMEFARQQYQREVNFMQWNDPVIINETNQPGLSVSNPAAQGDNSVNSTQFITGYSKETSTFTFAKELDPGITGSGLNGVFFDIVGYDGTTDFSHQHINSMKRFRCFISTGSGETFSVPSNISGVISASVDQVAAGTLEVSESLLNLFRDAINNQGATNSVAGFTNTIAPNTIFSGSRTDNVLTITREYNAGVSNIQLGGGSDTVNLSDTASVATPVEGQDTYHFAQGMQVFDGAKLPYAAMPRK